MCSPPKYDRITVEELLSGFEALGSLAQAFFERRIEFIASSSSLLAVDAPCVSKQSCIDFVANACAFERSKAARILDVLTLGGEARDGAWSRPLVPADGNHLYIVHSVLLTSSSRRLIDHWLITGGYSTDKKGKALEQIARDQLADTLDTNSMHLDAYVHRASCRYEGRKGSEIDALVRVGRSVLVCEIKCIAQPVTAMELANFLEKNVLKGVKQVANALAMAERQRRAVKRDTKYRGQSNDLVFTPLLLVSTGVASGWTIGGVSVLDICLLEKYLESGTLGFIFKDPGAIDAPRKTIILYHDQREAEANLQVYVSLPPTERLRQLRTRKVRAHSPDWGFGTTISERF